MTFDKLAKELDSINLVALVKYVDKISEITSVTKYNASLFMRDFIVAQDVSSTLLSTAIMCEARAKSQLDTAKAVALLDKSEEYFKEKGQKPTQDLRSAYVDLDSDVCEAKDLLARASATASFLKNKIYEFKSAFEATKQISRDFQATPYES